MAVPPVVAAELAKLTAEEVRKLRSTARRIGETVADQFGLTADHEYIGWRLLLLLGFEFYELKLKAPLKTAWVLEQQLVGVMDAAYRFFGAVGKSATALEHGTSILYGDLTAGDEAVYDWLTGSS